MMWKLLILGLLSQNLWAQMPKLKTVEKVDVERYTGRWYTVATLPQFYTRDCRGQIADYKIIDQKSISVKNTCLKVDGKKDRIKGVAKVKNKNTNAVLAVRFDSFFTKIFRVVGDYQILALTSDYQNVMVGSEDRQSLWIMSREKKMDQSIFDQFLNNAKEQGFHLADLQTLTYP